MFICEVCGKSIEKRHTIGGTMSLCEKHAKQYKKYGKFLDSNPRTIYDPNEIHIIGDVALVDIYNTNGDIVAQVSIDAEDVDKISPYKWRLNAGGYAVASATPGKRGSTCFMHRVIMGVTSDVEFVDHINHNTLDNCKHNLRIVSKSMNQMNSNNKGVYFDKKTNTYKPTIKIHQKMIMFKGFNVESHALLCRWYAEAILFREFRYPKPKPIVGAGAEREVYDYTYDRLLKFMPVLFVTSSGIRCFVDDRWIPFFIDTAGVVNYVNPNDGQFYYNNVAMQPAMYDCESNDIML